MDSLPNRYSLERELGRGGMGVVYRAFDRLENQLVALKRIETDALTLETNPLVASPRYQHMLLAHEFRTLASLRHPNIVSVLDYGFTSKHHPFFVMELLDETRTILQAAQAQDFHGKIDLLIQMLQAIMYLHHHNILHRDLKPSNVLVNQVGQVKVLDFGLAVKRGEQQERAGTLHYMAPEVLNERDAVEASDLYAVGVIAYKLFTGLEPFRGTYHEVLDQVWSAAPDLAPFEQLAQDNPAARQVAAVINRLMEKKPEDRYPNALAVVRALCETIGETLPPDEGPVRESFLQAATFVGRDRELEELRWALAKAKETTHGGVWLVGGESGIGKSRLLDELRIHALAEGTMVLRGQIIEGHDTLAHCWGEILRPLLLTTPISDAQADGLQAIIPDIHTLLGIDRATDSSADQDISPTILIAQVFSQITHPALLLLEDLQWAYESLEPLKMLIPLVENLPVLIVGSYRTEDRPHLAAELSGVNVIMLGKLSYDNIAELSSSMLGTVGHNPYILDLLYKETDGNAFFMVEVVRAWAEEAGQLGEIGQSDVATSVFTGGIHNIIQRRLKKLPDWAYDCLKVAAIMGRDLNLPVLDVILSPLLDLIRGDSVSMSVSTVWREGRGLNLNDWLLVCADAAILEVYESDWRFTHDKLREQTLADLGDDEMRVLRSQIQKAFKVLAR